jgi:predicted kinase
MATRSAATRSAATSSPSATPDRTIGIPEGALVVLVGPAGAGKTTFAHRHFRPTEILSSDAFRAMLTDDEADQRVSGPAFELLHLAAAGRLARRRTTVIDATNVTHDARRILMDIARVARRPAVAIVFDLPEADVQARNRQRPGRAVGDDVVARQAEAMRRAVERDAFAAEGFAEVHRLAAPADVDLARIERVGPVRRSRSVPGATTIDA